MQQLGGFSALAILVALLVSVLGYSQPSESAGISNKLVYVEFQASDLVKTQTFFERTFGWNFSDPTPTGVTFFDGRLSGSFIKSGRSGKRQHGGPLLSIYSDNLEETRRKVIANGGTVVMEISPTPDGRRFVFEEPSGGEFAAVSSR